MQIFKIIAQPGLQKLYLANPVIVRVVPVGVEPGPNIKSVVLYQLSYRTVLTAANIILAIII